MQRKLIVMVGGVLLAASVSAQPYGGGSAMMGGSGGWGMGSGMMGGAGAYGMGPEMMWGGYGGDALAGLELSAQQRKQISKIQEEVNKTHWQLMSAAHEQGRHMYQGLRPGKLDETSSRKGFESMQATQKAMFELSLGARRRIEAVLTKPQQEQLQNDWGGR